MRHETESLNLQLDRLNRDLKAKVLEVEQLQAQLAVEAVHDPLTQLFNRRYLDSVVPGLISNALRRGAPLGLALVDLDHFKRVNDHFGHPAGDHVLTQIGRLLAGTLRPSDVVCRYGGEEFCIVFPDTDAQGVATALATLAMRLAALELTWEGSVLGGFTFSAGVATLHDHGHGLTQLVNAADRALYAAKGAGRDRVLLAPADAWSQPVEHAPKTPRAASSTQ